MLIKSSDTLKEFANISGSLNYASAKATLRTVEQDFLVPVLGEDLFDVLDDAFDEATEQNPLHEDWVDLLFHCRQVVGPFFCYLYSDIADVHLSDAGMQRVETGNNKTAYQEQRSKYKEANLLLGENAIEKLLKFLDQNSSRYPEWTDSQEYKDYKSLFITSGDAFNEVYRSPSPYRNYQALRPYMQDTEELIIRKFLGKVLFDNLKSKLAAQEPNLTEEEKELIQKISKAVVFLSLAAAAPLLHVRIGTNGITIPSAASFNGNDLDNTRGGITDKHYSTFISACSEKGSAWLTAISDFLTLNKTQFSSWIGFATTSSEPENENQSNEDIHSTFGF